MHMLIKAHQPNLFQGGLSLEPSGKFRHRNARCSLRGIAIHAATDGRKSERAQAMRNRERQAIAVAGYEGLRLSTGAALPYGTNGVNDVLRRQPITLCEARLSRRAATETAAFFEQSRTRGAMNRPIDTAAAQ